MNEILSKIKGHLHQNPPPFSNTNTLFQFLFAYFTNMDIKVTTSLLQLRLMKWKRPTTQNIVTIVKSVITAHELHMDVNQPCFTSKLSTKTKSVCIYALKLIRTIIVTSIYNAVPTISSA